MSDKKFIYLTVVITMLILVGFATKAMAQGTSEIRFKGWGIRAGLSSDPDQVYGGVHLDLGELIEDVRFRPTVEFGLGDDQKVLQVLAEVHQVFSKFRVCKPYLGAGLGLTYINYDDDHLGDDSVTEGSVVLIGGIETELSQAVKLFFEFKVGLANEDPEMKFGVGLSW